MTFVVWAINDSEAQAFGRRLPRGQVIQDNKGSLARSCEVRATPTMLLVSRQDWRALEVNLEGDTEWAIRRLTAPTPVLTTL